MKIALDCAHGAAYMVAPKVFHELGAELVLVGAEPNGTNINDKVGATSPQSIRDAVLKSSCTCLIGLFVLLHYRVEMFGIAFLIGW